MAVSSIHVLRQGPMLKMLGETALKALTQRPLPKGSERATVATPGAEAQRSYAPLHPDLLDAFVQHLGGDPRAYRGLVPPHLFPQWVMPVAAKTMANLPYPLTRTVNGGCRLQINSALPRNEALDVRATLVNVDDDGRRAVITTRIVTSTKSAPEALIAEIYGVVPLSSGKKDGANKEAAKGAPLVAKERKEKTRVPRDAREVASYRLRADAGLSFAKLTGDFNPIHWIAPAAKAAGFQSVILHGFGTMAYAYEGLLRGVFSGDARQLKVLDVKLTRPLVLPHDIGVFVHQNQVFVGDAPSGPAYLTGRFETGDQS
jgi:acyl dehydratase